jgi:hypothetical protein
VPFSDLLRDADGRRRGGAAPRPGCPARPRPSSGPARTRWWVFSRSGSAGTRWSGARRGRPRRHDATRFLPGAPRGGPLVRGVYNGAAEVTERHRHRYEVNVNYRDRLEEAGLRFSGMSPDGILPEIVERPDHPVVHRRAVSPRAEIQALRAAPPLPGVHRGGGPSIPPDVRWPARRPPGAGSRRWMDPSVVQGGTFYGASSIASGRGTRSGRRRPEGVRFRGAHVARNAAKLAA